MECYGQASYLRYYVGVGGGRGHVLPSFFSLSVCAPERFSYGDEGMERVCDIEEKGEGRRRTIEDDVGPPSPKTFARAAIYLLCSLKRGACRWLPGYCLVKRIWT